MTSNDIEKAAASQLSRRERQIMDALFEAGELSAQDVREAIPDAPSYSAVRALLAKLVEKQIVDFREEGPRYIYFPRIAQEEARTSALQKLLKTFFGGSTAAAVNALLGMNKDKLSADEIVQLQQAIDEAANVEVNLSAVHSTVKEPSSPKKSQ
ncbi:BlaI/MecI/CopY family transcriptional regulator [Cellvibrio sp. QJXJ]|jgi:predicted transcriptional regulator|uniref:BlaI/MecI/CopY family transcriptional regulator n=1 Tax=Cellvibrio sp. QJXJ TaxID=2964606 RepID=UPI0021C3C600|nr:BlaI/MecI/CopY family transcriptional regulator [Cellvibrio sp. QJXJ]UUA72646.1 BlaI/MecI/CopY family transcriptional regulator [Cellvibrio sp. QJXJ]